MTDQQRRALDKAYRKALGRPYSKAEVDKAVERIKAKAALK